MQTEVKNESPNAHGRVKPVGSADRPGASGTCGHVHRDGRDGLDPSEGFHPWDVVSTVTTLSE